MKIQILTGNELKWIDINDVKRKSVSRAALKKFVETPRKKNVGYLHPDWPQNIWSKPVDEIMDFLKKRFKETADEMEYYNVMRMLYKTLPEKELLVPFSSIKGSHNEDKEISSRKSDPVVSTDPKKKSESNLDLDSKTAGKSRKKQVKKVVPHKKVEMYETY